MTILIVILSILFALWAWIGVMIILESNSLHTKWYKLLIVSGPIGFISIIIAVGTFNLINKFMPAIEKFLKN